MRRTSWDKLLSGAGNTLALARRRHYSRDVERVAIWSVRGTRRSAPAARETMVMIVPAMFAGDSSRGGACSVHGTPMIQRPATTAGGCGERRRGSPRRLPRQLNWSTYNPLQPTREDARG